MRILVCSILSAAMLGGTYAAVTWRRSADLVEDGVLHAAISARRALEREVRIRAAMKEVELNPLGWPRTIDPAWFGASPPRNPYVSADHPWVEVASADQSNLMEPPIRQALTADVAGYWYNPSNGIIRARVGAWVTDAGAIELYNRMNSSAVSSLFAGDQPAVPAADAMKRGGSRYLKNETQPKASSRTASAQ